MKKRKHNNSLLNFKLDKILQLQKLQIKNQNKLKEMEEEELEDEEQEKIELKHLESGERIIEKELEELTQLEHEIKQNVAQHPLRKITYKDLGKSMIGAFIGIVSHYAVLEGIHYSETINLVKANAFYLAALLVAFIFLYYTGFRKIRDVRVLSFLPLRLILVYTVTIITILIVLLIFGELGHGIHETYKTVSALMLPAIIGACAADLIGGD